jgi:hypothetical protein
MHKSHLRVKKLYVDHPYVWQKIPQVTPKSSSLPIRLANTGFRMFRTNPTALCIRLNQILSLKDGLSPKTAERPTCCMVSYDTYRLVQISPIRLFPLLPWAELLVELSSEIVTPELKAPIYWSNNKKCGRRPIVTWRVIHRSMRKETVYGFEESVNQDCRVNRTSIKDGLRWHGAKSPSISGLRFVHWCSSLDFKAVASSFVRSWEYEQNQWNLLQRFESIIRTTRCSIKAQTQKKLMKRPSRLTLGEESIWKTIEKQNLPRIGRQSQFVGVLLNCSTS